MTQSFSAVIIAKNEAHIIGLCITALLKVTDDIVLILDDTCQDDTGLIAEKLGAKVHIHPWMGYSKTKNYGASLAKNDWILCLDADEVIDDTLISHLHNLKPDSECIYEMNRQTWFNHYAVKHSGWFPDWVIRLYNKKNAQWNNALVHEKLESNTVLKSVKLPGLIFHHSFTDIRQMKDKFDRYARLRALEWVNTNKKPSRMKQWFGPYFRFFRTYILKSGFLDGKVGLLIARNECLLKKKEIKYWKEFLHLKNIKNTG